jgi:hypothetical protein
MFVALESRRYASVEEFDCVSGDMMTRLLMYFGRYTSGEHVQLDYHGCERRIGRLRQYVIDGGGEPLAPSARISSPLLPGSARFPNDAHAPPAPIRECTQPDI